jgi:hypothetical protein
MLDNVTVGQIWKYDSEHIKSHDGDYVIIIEIEADGPQPIIVNMIVDADRTPIRYDEPTIKRLFKRIS